MEWHALMEARFHLQARALSVLVTDDSPSVLQPKW
jgi:hypothetical protein